MVHECLRKMDFNPSELGTVRNRAGSIIHGKNTLLPMEIRTPKTIPCTLRSNYVQLRSNYVQLRSALRKNYGNIT